MKRLSLIAATMLALGACASGPPIPDWQMNAKSGLERAVAAYLSGNDRLANAEFARARSDMSSSGQFSQVARAELTRCAAHLASLVLDDCPAFEALRPDAGAPERAYADYLAGHAQAGDAALLPQAQRALLTVPAEPAITLAAIGDPFSRLVAAGVLLRSGHASPAVLALAVDTASSQGWRRPLLAWLGTMALRAEQAGDAAQAQRLRRRMDLVQEVPAR
ncbi:MAG: hypothetical protein V4582_19395 [Pseudomonadota bacterium]